MSGSLAESSQKTCRSLSRLLRRWGLILAAGSLVDLRGERTRGAFLKVVGGDGDLASDEKMLQQSELRFERLLRSDLRQSASLDHERASQLATRESRILHARKAAAVYAPKQYRDVRSIGEMYRDEVPVMVDLHDTPEDVARRCIDFGAGLAFGLQGEFVRLDAKMFLLVPSESRSDTLGASLTPETAPQSAAGRLEVVAVDVERLLQDLDRSA